VNTLWEFGHSFAGRRDQTRRAGAFAQATGIVYRAERQIRGTKKSRAIRRHREADFPAAEQAPGNLFDYSIK